MPARIVVVHDDAEFTLAIEERFRPDVRIFGDSVAALNLLRAARTVEFLITRVTFDDRQSIGLSLARVTRLARPNVRIVFTGKPEHQAATGGLGEFLTEPVAPIHVGMVVEWLSGRPLHPSGNGLSV